MGKGRPLSDEERARRRAEDRDRLEQAARALLSSDGWQQWVRVRSRNGLSRYSLLILSRTSRRRGMREVVVGDMSSTACSWRFGYSVLRAAR